MIGEQNPQRRQRFAVIALLGGALAGLGLAEGLSALFFARDQRGFGALRAALRGESRTDATREAIGQPYRLYAPAPGFANEYGAQNNRLGYRGRPVPLRPRPGVARLLFLGGSTTYTDFARTPAKAYPAQVERIVRSRLPKGLTDVEAINGGLNHATSAELLTHYHFKYRYFRPNVVVINAGGNDAFTAFGDYYQPDYSHRRKPVARTRPLLPLGRALLASHFGSLALLNVLAGGRPGVFEIERHGDLPPPAAWYPAARRDDPRTVGFGHNLEALIDEITADGARVVLVPFRLGPKAKHAELITRVARTEALLLQIAARHDVLVAPFPADAIEPKHWVDECHVAEAGARDKAEHVAHYVLEAL